MATQYSEEASQRQSPVVLTMSLVQVFIMPSSKTDTSIRLPQREDQQRHLRNVTQDRRWAAKMQNQASSGKQKADESTTWSADQLLGSQIDSAGQPVPNPVSTGDGAKEKKKKGSMGEEADMYEAMSTDSY